MRILIDHLPPDSATARHVAGHQWTIDHVLLSRIEFDLRVLAWQGGMGKGKKPEPITLPGLVPEKREDHWGGAGVPLEVMRERLGW